VKEEWLNGEQNNWYSTTPPLLIDENRLKKNHPFLIKIPDYDKIF